MILDFDFGLAFGSDQLHGLSEMNFADQVMEDMSRGGIDTSFELMFGATSAREDSGRGVSRIGGVDWMEFGAGFGGDGADDLTGGFLTQVVGQGRANGDGEIMSKDQTLGKFQVGTEGSHARWSHLGQDAGSFSGSSILAQLTRSDHFEFKFQPTTISA